MTRTTKREYIKITQERYFKSNRKQKATILNELSQTLAIHRKSAIRLLNSPPGPKKINTNPSGIRFPWSSPFAFSWPGLFCWGSSLLP